MTLIAISLAMFLVTAGVASGNTGDPTVRPRWIDPFAWAVAVCETGKGHRYPDFQHQAGPYGGAWGWYVSTWQADRVTRAWRTKTGKWKGFPLFPWNATPQQQYRVFQIGRARGRYWGCIHGGGYRFWM